MSSDFSNKPRIFISYSRKDGEAFAADLRRKLIDIVGEVALWRDRDRMEGGVAWWNQITEALDNVQFMVLVATPAAMESAIVRKEWRYARQQGVCVYPVQVPGLALDFAAMPRWMRDSHFYDLDKEWDTFVNYLQSPCNAPRVAFMAPDLPTHFVERPREFDALVNLLLDSERDNPVAITTALRGAGGFGKTTLAAALCHDEDVQQAFDDGVLWVTLGEKPNLVDALTKLYRALTDENPGFVDVEEGATKLAERLADHDCLMVIDDVWNPVHLKPFLRGGERCARLVTTRLLDVAVEANAQRIDVDEMTTDESVRLLLAGIDPQPDDVTPFAALAERLGEWALLLEVTNGTLRKRIEKGASLDAALEYVNTALTKRGVGGLKRGTSDAAVQVLDTSIDLLAADQQRRLYELAIFAEDSDIDTTSVMALWDIDAFDTEELLDLFDDLSFVRLDAELGTIRLHDVVREVLADKLDDPAAVHRGLIDNYGDLTQLPDDYAWNNIAYHLIAADQRDTLRNLLLTTDYLQNKLNATADPNTLIADCDAHSTNNNAIRLVKSALSISSHILSEYPEQGLTHIYGRLLSYHDDYPEIAELLDAIANHKTHPALLTAQPTLQQAGGPLLRTFTGHTSYVKAAAFAPDGNTIISASNDGTLKLWDVATGQELRTFAGHTASVNGVAFAPDGSTALSASGDKTLKLWDVATGQELRTFTGHTNWVNGVAFAPDGSTALSASNDQMLKLWDVATGQEIRTFTGHTNWVNGVAFAPDGSTALSASRDKTLKLWDVATGQELRTFTGHTNWVRAVAFAPDGSTALSASEDNTLKLWDVHSGQELRTFTGHTDRVTGVAFAPDGSTALSASNDQTLKLWDVATGQEIRTFTGHTNWVNGVAFAPDGSTALSASNDQTLKLWDVHSGQELRTFTGHTNWVRAVAFAPDGSIALFESLDNTLKLWDVVSGQILQDQPDTPANRAALYRQYGVSLDPVLPEWDLLLLGSGNAVEIRRGEQRLFAFATDGTVYSSGVALALHIAVGDRGGVVHILRPNPTLRRLMMGAE